MKRTKPSDCSPRLIHVLAQSEKTEARILAEDIADGWAEDGEDFVDDGISLADHVECNIVRLFGRIAELEGVCIGVIEELQAGGVLAIGLDRETSQDLAERLAKALEDA